MTRASYDLTRLRRNGLITCRPDTATYDLTEDGQLFAVFYNKVCDQVLYPLMAGQRIATPAEVGRALAVIDRHIASLAAAACMPRAA